MTDNPAIDTYDLAIAERIRTVRQQRKITQQKVAADLGVSYQQLQKYETGANRISAGRLHQLAELLEVPISVFFEGQDGDRGSVTDAVELDLLDLFRDLPSPALQAFVVRVVRDLRSTTKGEARSARKQGVAEPEVPRGKDGVGYGQVRTGRTGRRSPFRSSGPK